MKAPPFCTFYAKSPKKSIDAHAGTCYNYHGKLWTKLSERKENGGDGMRGAKGNILRKIGRAAWKTVLVLLSVLVLAVLVLWTIPLFERPADAAVSGSGDWMAALPDDIPLDRISIPGTHDTGTANAQLAFFSRCQHQGIARQLADGFRYLDIRLAVRKTKGGNTLVLMHGVTLCRETYLPWGKPLTLASVLADCYAFLDAHPGETILFTVSRERGADSVAEIQTLLADAVREQPGYWYAGDGSRLPTLGEARGTLVLLRRFNDDAGLGTESGIHFDWHDQGGYSDPPQAYSEGYELSEDVRLFVEDRYEYETAEKWDAYRAPIEASDTEQILPLRFLSTKGHAEFGHPYRFARRLNALLLENGALPGWTVVDFGTAAAAEKIYSLNFSAESP